MSLFSGSFPLASSNRKENDVYGPYHAPHLHIEEDAKSIIGFDTQSNQLLDRYSSEISILSTSTGSWFDAHTGAAKLLISVISDILIQPLRVQTVLDTCVQTIADSKILKCTIISCGSSEFQSVLLADLKSRTEAEVSLQRSSPEISSTTQINKSPAVARRSKLAIVGMAGRFPNAADHEKFWSLLEAGSDVHKKVGILATPG